MSAKIEERRKSSASRLKVQEADLNEEGCGLYQNAKFISLCLFVLIVAFVGFGIVISIFSKGTGKTVK